MPIMIAYWGLIIQKLRQPTKRRKHPEATTASKGLVAEKWSKIVHTHCLVLRNILQRTPKPTLAEMTSFHLIVRS